MFWFSKLSVLEEFRRKWCHPEDAFEGVTADDLRAAEGKLDLIFPEDYRSMVLTVGLPSPTLALLSSILDRSAEIFDLAALHTPEEIVTETVSWREIGMPGDLVAIGRDCSGNMFCFKEADIRGKFAAKAPVYFWDHDFNTTTRVAASFTKWIGGYVGGWSRGLTYKDF